MFCSCYMKTNTLNQLINGPLCNGNNLKNIKDSNLEIYFSKVVWIYWKWVFLPDFPIIIFYILVNTITIVRDAS